MKVIKYLLLLVLLILIGGGLYILISDKAYRIEEKLTIQAPRELVFEHVKDLKEWQNWVHVDQKNLNLSFSRKKDGEQSYLTWKNTKTGEEGKLSHKTITHYSTIRQNAKSESRWGARTRYTINWNFYKIGKDSTQIDVSLKAYPNYLAKIKIAFHRDHHQTYIEDRLPASLQRIDQLIHKKMAAYKLTIEGIVHRSSPQNYIYRTQASTNKPETVMNKRRKILKLLHRELDSLKINPTGSALMVYNTVDKKHQNLIFSAGYPISSTVNPKNLGENDPVIGTLEAREYLKATLQGNYSNIPKLWEKASVYMQQNDLNEDPGNQAYEVFEITATHTPNPAEWVTELYIPIQHEEISTIEEINKRLN